MLEATPLGVLAFVGFCLRLSRLVCGVIWCSGQGLPHQGRYAKLGTRLFIFFIKFSCRPRPFSRQRGELDRSNSSNLDPKRRFRDDKASFNHALLHRLVVHAVIGGEHVKAK